MITVMKYIYMLLHIVVVFSLTISPFSVTEHQDNDEVTLHCSVVPYGGCEHKVKWLLQDQDVDKDHREIKTSQSSCSASVTFLTSHFSNTTRFELFTCEVRDGANMQTFSPQSSGENMMICLKSLLTGVKKQTSIFVYFMDD